MPESNDSFLDLFNAQFVNQERLLQQGKYEGFTDRLDFKPVDDPRLCSYHIQQLMSEIGEVLEADKRWKNFRNEKVDRAAKADEIADCFIVLMNVAMFSGMTAQETYDAIKQKIKVVNNRIKNC